ncbi:MAG: molecular chaperone TorD family protein [Deltaproteobacteria bacterium]|nr:molecular chaperone TorD family protein [Deltaproteobacteria bacterium]
MPAIRDGVVSAALRQALEDVDPGLAEDVDWLALENAGTDDDDLAVEYTRLFDVGASGPPCPLYGGLYGGARMKNMEEAVRFYNHFGLKLSEAEQELPDHLTTELEFMHFLAFEEASALTQGTDASAFQRAQRDFVSRHPGRWVPALRKRLEQRDPPPFFREVVRQLERFLMRDGGRLFEQLGAPQHS